MSKLPITLSAGFVNILKMIEKSLKVEIEKDVFDTSKLEAQKNLLHLKNLHESLKDFGDETALKISVLRELWI